ncbi:MAG: SH3 domain-containing protein [Agathobacter sp.]|nr:SH3 domain-containing protein [Agathobacter sp.]
MKKKQVLPVLIIAGLIILGFLIFGGSKLIEKYSPSKELMDLNKYYNLEHDSQIAITLNNTVLENHATIINEAIYLDYKFVHDYLNKRFYWDANENILLYTTASHIISAKADATSYYIGKSSSDYGRPIVKATADSAWVDLEFVKKYSDFAYSFYESPSRLVITNEWKEITISALRGNAEIRFEEDIKSPILADVKKGDVLTILEDDGKWAKVGTQDGIIGYIRSNEVKHTETKTIVSEYEEETFYHIKRDKTINFLWHPVSKPAANSEITTIISTTKGVDVVSPTWFKLKDNKGNISSFASSDYVTYCHDHNVEVWALVSNLYLPSDVDINYILTHTSSRQNLVNQLISQALQYNLDGLNVDFETLSEAKIGDAYIQFLRELSIKCENNDIILSTAVGIPASFNSEYRYSEQANFVDYICLMAYDQHYGIESGEGPVASLDWVEESVKNTLAEGIPADQLILGVPFYSRLWELTPSQDSDTSETIYSLEKKPTALGLTSAQTWMDNNISSPEWLEDAGQYYGQIKNNGVVYKMWLEDETSIEEKLKVMQEYKLAGAAFWSSDWDNTSIWEVIIKYIN